MRLKTLNGAPRQEELSFDEEHLLQLEELSRFKISATPVDSECEAPLRIKWRQVQVGSRLRTRWSQPSLPEATFDPGQLIIENMDTMSDPLDASTVLEESTIIAPDNNEFVQHSLLLHDTLLSSQIYPGESQDSFEEADSLLSEPSYIAPFKAATPASSFSIAESGGRTLLLPPHLVTVPLSDLPTARHLRSIYPQTPTPTFLCVLTEDVQVREVFVRKGGYKMDLYEAIVADHTRSGFKVSFWYKPNQARDQIQEGWRMSLEEAKVGDVLLLRNIVLNAFRDQVFGQSLNSSITKARTAVDILWRADGLRGYRNISPSSIDQDFRRVKKWAQMHIVPAYPPVKKRKSHRESSERSSKKTLGKPFLKDDGLPPDTME